MSSLQQIRFFESIALKSNLSGRFQHKNEDMKGSFRLAANLLQPATVPIICSKLASPLRQSLRLVWTRLKRKKELAEYAQKCWQTVWPVKSRHISIKVGQKWFH